MKKQTLLERAKKVKIREYLNNRFFSDEEIELAFGWLTDEIKLSQFTKVMWNKNAQREIGGKALYTIASILKYAYRKGRLSIK